MKQVKLLTLTSWNYLAIFLLLLLLFFGLFYFIIRKEVLASADEALYNRKIHILEEFKKNGGKVPPEVFEYTDFRIAPSTPAHAGNDRYSDTLIYELADEELDEFRKLSSSFEVDGKFYRLEVVKARLETHEIAESIAQSLAVVLILMVGVFYFTTRYFSRKLWKSFYTTLEQLNQYEVDQSSRLSLTTGRIEEFTMLNKSILDLTDRTRTTFLNQKQFIENASHEILTPLAVIQSKLELLIEDPHLTENQSEIVQALINSTERLSKLNKTLLLLSKIENQQFLEKETVALRPLIEEILTYFEEQRENFKIKVDLDIAGSASLHGSRVLIDLLLTNLIKNAFFHNSQNGSIHIGGDGHRFLISNTSDSDVIPAGKLFQRFYKQSRNRESWGLGLAIIKKICDTNLWKIYYTKAGASHSFEVVFQ